MPLTTEQKINLLILAGFEPWVAWRDSPRICAGHSRPYSTGYTVDGQVIYQNNDRVWRYAECNCTITDKLVEWGSIPVHEIPDELIYQAIEA